MGNSLGTIIVILLAAALVAFACLYNGLIARRNQIQNISGSLDALLRKRFDLIPNLVATVRGVTRHEHDVLEKIARLRAQAASPAARLQTPEDDALSATLQQIFVLSESYPELRANQNFLHLQGALTEMEEQISAARRAYNASVTDYNNAVEMMPSSLVANMMGMKAYDWYEAEAEARHAVSIAGKLSR